MGCAKWHFSPDDKIESMLHKQDKRSMLSPKHGRGDVKTRGNVQRQCVIMWVSQHTIPIETMKQAMSFKDQDIFQEATEGKEGVNLCNPHKPFPKLLSLLVSQMLMFSNALIFLTTIFLSRIYYLLRR